MEVRNVDIVRQWFTAFERRDVDAWIAISHPDVVFQPVTANVAAGGHPYRGHDGLRSYFEDVARVWQELRPEPDTFYEREPGTIVATGRVYAWGAGRVVDSPAGWILRIRDGRISYGQTFETATAALLAGGIRDGDAAL
jgi:ketosteroid isomerase-like protein